MIRLSTLPSAREQAHHVLTLLGVPATARLIVDVHGGLFPGDLTLGALAGLMRQEESAGVRQEESASLMRQQDLAHLVRHGQRLVDGHPPYRFCVGLGAADLAPVRGLIALSSWDLIARIVTVTSARVDALTAVVRVAEFVAVQPGASPAASRLLRGLAEVVPGGPEAYDVMDPGALADAARAALAEPVFAAATAKDRLARTGAAERALARLDERQRLFGLRTLPRQGGAPGAGR